MRATADAAAEYVTALDMEHQLSAKSAAQRKGRMPLTINDTINVAGLLARAQQSACILTSGTWA